MEWRSLFLYHHHFAAKARGSSSRMVGALVQEHRNTYRVKKEKQLSLLVRDKVTSVMFAPYKEV
ncbi:hypothetical protein ACFQDF_33495 [Ectobacillus funiculus]